MFVRNREKWRGMCVCEESVWTRLVWFVSVSVLIGGLLSWKIIHLSPSGPLAADSSLHARAASHLLSNERLRVCVQFAEVCDLSAWKQHSLTIRLIKAATQLLFNLHLKSNFYFFFTPFHISALGHMKAFNIDCNVEGVQRAHRLILQLLIYLERERWCSASPLKHNTIASFFNPAWVIQSADGNMKYCRNCERWILHWSLGDEVFFSKHHGQCGVWMCVGVSVCVRERSWCASRLIWTMFIHRIRLFGWNVGRLHETTWQTLLKGMQY